MKITHKIKVGNIEVIFEEEIKRLKEAQAFTNLVTEYLKILSKEE